MGLKKYAKMYMYHYSIIQSILTALKMFSSLPNSSSLPTTFSNPLIFCIISIVLLFSEFHIVGITKYEPFKDSLTELYAFISSIHFHVKVAQSCLTLCDSMDYTVHGILQARILE